MRELHAWLDAGAWHVRPGTRTPAVASTRRAPSVMTPACAAVRTSLAMRLRPITAPRMPAIAPLLNEETPHVCGGSSSGASRARTGDLLHAMQAAGTPDFSVSAGHSLPPAGGLVPAVLAEFPSISDRIRALKTAVFGPILRVHRLGGRFANSPPASRRVTVRAARSQVDGRCPQLGAACHGVPPLSSLARTTVGAPGLSLRIGVDEQDRGVVAQRTRREAEHRVLQGTHGAGCRAPAHPRRVRLRLSTPNSAPPLSRRSGMPSE